MATTLYERSILVDEPRREVAHRLADVVLAQHEDVPEGVDAGAERRRRAAELVSFADGRREPIEHIRLGFLRRLHRASDDFAATEGLRVVEAALSLIPRKDPPTEERPDPQRRRRRWFRRRSLR